LGDKSAVIDSMVKAVNAEKNNITYRFNLGRALQERGEGSDIENAQKIFENILAVNPDEVNTAFALGTLYEKQGEKEKAIDMYEKVIAKVKQLDTDSGDTVSKLSKMIDNVKKGISNDETALNGQENMPIEQSNPNPENPNVDLISPDANSVNDVNLPVSEPQN